LPEQRSDAKGPVAEDALRAFVFPFGIQIRRCGLSRALVAGRHIMADDVLLSDNKAQLT
jgi:hypothetical protein